MKKLRARRRRRAGGGLNNDCSSCKSFGRSFNRAFFPLGHSILSEIYEKFASAAAAARRRGGAVHHFLDTTKMVLIF